jgi:hypothetical protein
VDGLALKLVLTPTLIGAVSLAGRRWGPGVSGWLVGFPLTSGPVALFLALDHGLAFAAGAAAGSMTGAAAQAVFCVVYGRCARGRHWAVPLAVGSLGFALASAALQMVTLTLLPLLALVIGTLVVALGFMPRATQGPRAARRPPWDIPARIVVTTAIVLLLTGLAAALGPSLTGLLATYPLYGAILSGFAHHLEGPGPAVRVLRGLLLGLFAFAGFFFVLALLIERSGLAPAFAAAVVTALALQAGALWAMRRDSGA